MKIYKYLVVDTHAEMPIGAKIRKVAWQDKMLTIWAEVDPSERHERRCIVFFGTGCDAPSEGTYLDTVFEGPFVWHLYELPIAAVSEGEK